MNKCLQTWYHADMFIRDQIGICYSRISRDKSRYSAGKCLNWSISQSTADVYLWKVTSRGGRGGGVRSAWNCGSKSCPLLFLYSVCPQTSPIPVPESAPFSLMLNTKRASEPNLPPCSYNSYDLIMLLITSWMTAQGCRHQVMKERTVAMKNNGCRKWKRHGWRLCFFI